MTKTIHPDLQWLANNVSEWNSKIGLSHIIKCGNKHEYVPMDWVYYGMFIARGHIGYNAFTRAQWQAAREDLGLAMTSDEEEITAEDYQRAQAHVCDAPASIYFDMSDGKQPRYQDEEGGDWIDECAKTFTPEEFRGAMRFTIGKYNRRVGKKDEITEEIRKMRDYCDRWLAVEESA